MSNKWTIESISGVINRIAICKDESEIMLVSGLYPTGLELARATDMPITVKDLTGLEFYDNNMNLISPPKERELEIIVECMSNQSLKTEFFSDSDIIHGYTKLPNGRRYKRYKDNGELEVIDGE